MIVLTINLLFKIIKELKIKRLKNYEKTLVELKENLKDLVREFAAVDLINYQGFLLDDYQPKMSYRKFRNEIEDLIEVEEYSWDEIIEYDFTDEDLKDIYRAYSDAFEEIFNKVKNGDSWLA